MLKKLMVFTFFVFSCNGCLFAMDDSVERLINKYSAMGMPVNVIRGDLRMIIDPKDRNDNIVTKIYKIHSDRPLIETEEREANGRIVINRNHPETLMQRIVKSSDGSKQVTMYDEHGNLIE